MSDIEAFYRDENGKKISWRDKKMRDATDWQIKQQPSMTSNGVFIPSLEYNIISDLKGLVLSLETQLERAKEGKK